MGDNAEDGFKGCLNSWVSIGGSGNVDGFGDTRRLLLIIVATPPPTNAPAVKMVARTTAGPSIFEILKTQMFIKLSGPQTEWQTKSNAYQL